MQPPSDTEVSHPPPRQIPRERQAAIGLTLATLVIVAWLAAHITGVFFMPLAWEWAWLIVPFVVLQCWLYVGLFIVAHDCMHGSLVPFRPQINRAVGQLCLLLYAGFSFDNLNKAHHRHHRYSGTADDPDFDDHPPYGFWRWYAKFFTEYFSWREFVFIGVLIAVYVGLFGAGIGNIIVFWAIPALASSLQLFSFGTYLPHRPGPDTFEDRHRTRTNRYPAWMSLLTCFHFGYHHEHHLYPDLPWWRLPDAHAKYFEAGTTSHKAHGRTD